MSSGAPAVAPTVESVPYAQRITLAPVGSFTDTIAKLEIGSLGITNPIPANTLQGHGQGIYYNVVA